ncbi:MAG TPA: hypothetical protein VGL19_14425 [Polyangiaceae bacterium]
MTLTAHWTKNTVAFAGYVLALLGGACSGSTQTTVPVDQLATEFGNALCDSVAPCCSSASIVYDSVACKATATGLFQNFVSSNTSPNTTYDAAAAGRCLDTVKASLQACSGLDNDAVNNTCANIFVGTLPAGSACTKNPECAGGARCEPDTAAPTPAHCMAPTLARIHGKAGQACDGSCITLGTATECLTSPSSSNSPAASTCYSSDGLHCSSQTQVCIAFAQVGQACESQGCVAGAFCDAGTCAAMRDSGSCLAAPDACSNKSFCDATGQCLPKKADGAPCEQSSDCASDVCSVGVSGARVCGAVTPRLCAGNVN